SNTLSIASPALPPLSSSGRVVAWPSDPAAAGLRNCSRSAVRMRVLHGGCSRATSRKGRCPMLHLGHEKLRGPAGFVVKHCVLCLSTRLHAVEISNTELAGFAYGTRAFLICQECGFEREVAGRAVRSLIETAVSRTAIVETLDAGYIDGDLGED